MTIKEKDILNALKNVMDPDLGKDLVTLGMIQNITINGKDIRFSLVLTTPSCPLKDKLKTDCIHAIHVYVDSDAKVEIDITSQVTSKRQDEKEILPDVKNIIAIASGKGGVGKSTIAANLALGLAKDGAKVGLMDADIFGPSIHVMLGLEGYHPKAIAINGKEMMEPAEKFGIKVMSIGFLLPDNKQAIVWRGPMASSAILQILGECNWGALDYLIVDLPPGTSDIHLSLVQSVPVTGAIIVSTPQNISLIDAQKALSMFQVEAINVPILGIIENMAYFTPTELPDNKYYIFGKDGGKKIAKANKVPLLGQIPIVQRIQEESDSGNPTILKGDKITSTAFYDLSQKIAQQIAVRNATLKPTKKVVVSK